MSICILADALDIDRAKLIELEYMSVDDLKKLNKNKKLVKVRLSPFHSDNGWTADPVATTGMIIS